MAAVSVSPSPHTLTTMSNRRVPLSSNPNAVNSPYRAVVAAGQKQKRSYATIQREEAYGQAPPAKKQMLDGHTVVLKTPPRQSALQVAEGRVFTRKSNQPTAFDKKLEAVRNRSISQVTAKAEKTSEENLETIRQWQRHYRKVFPKYVFYFESVADDVQAKCARQVAALGAGVEKFFSNAVTHVITTRTIPPEQETGVDTYAEPANDHQQLDHPQTINPLLLDRSSESTPATLDVYSGRLRIGTDVTLGQRHQTVVVDAESRKYHTRNADVLHRARALGMKLWALEKLQRMMTTMFDTDTGLQVTHGHNTRSNSNQADLTAAPRAQRNADLSQMLRNERINGPSDRDLTVASGEIVVFKGPYIYVHDMDEKHRPVMVREYAKVANKEDGDWPQFRSVANGKCPFVEEIDYSRREQEKEVARLSRQAEQAKSAVPRTRAATAEATKMQPPRAANGRAILIMMEDGQNLSRRTAPSKTDDPLGPPDLRPANHEPSLSGPQNAFVSRAGVGMPYGGEPAASGIQPSNVTSAIRSQMISSTAAAPGAKAGTSKEVHGLQRKVLERNSGPTSLGLASSHRMTDLVAAAKEDMNTKASRQKKVQDKLGFVDEDPTPTEVEEARRAEATRKAKAVQKRKSEKRDPKPGYCENCYDKFEDFDEHIQSRKHRKFAEKNENWKELDALLSQLKRPLKNTGEADRSSLIWSGDPALAWT